MNDADIELRNATYAAFVRLRRAPTAAELATYLGINEDHVVAA